MLPQRAIRTLATELLQRHPLRAADALQLAAALAARANGAPLSNFLALDRRLAEAAKAEGFALSPELNQ
ncbi:MAG: hypothetical protein HYX53_13050 [Chloroflexi bacterium]|nr:hypothetical protein [Chloroflexota bacterium]